VTPEDRGGPNTVGRASVRSVITPGWKTSSRSSADRTTTRDWRSPRPEFATTGGGDHRYTATPITNASSGRLRADADGHTQVTGEHSQQYGLIRLWYPGGDRGNRAH
jgi:hypothetical protein